METLLYLVVIYVWASGCEWFAHKYILHHRFSFNELPYKRHTDHHKDFNRSAFCDLEPEKEYTGLDLCWVHEVMFMLPLAILFLFLNPWMVVVILAFSYLHFILYSELHVGMHKGHKMTLAPKFLQRITTWNHFMHHRHPTKFFCVVLPGYDYIVGDVCQMTTTDLEDYLRNVLPLQNQVDKPQQTGKMVDKCL